MRNHQEQQHDHQEVMVPMTSQENLNLETTHNHHHNDNNHHHLMVPVDSQKRSDLETIHNHHLVMESHENPNLETTRNHRLHHVPTSPSSSSSQDSKTTHYQHMGHAVKKTHVDEGFISKNACDKVIKKSYDVYSSSVAAGGDMTTPPPPPLQEESGRERLKRHRVEMAGRVWIPDIWGHEDLLKDWIDCTVFDSSLGNNTIMSARAALVQEGRSTLRIENRC